MLNNVPHPTAMLEGMTKIALRHAVRTAIKCYCCIGLSTVDRLRHIHLRSQACQKPTSHPEWASRFFVPELHQLNAALSVPGQCIILDLLS